MSLLSRQKRNRTAARIRSRVKGFTLVELVVVITVLGILAVTALSTFQSFRKDAKISALHGAKDAFATLNTQVYAKAVFQGEENNVAGTNNIDLDGDGNNDIRGYYGLIYYVRQLEKWLILGDDFTISSPSRGNPANPIFIIGFGPNKPTTSTKCHVEIYYPQDASGDVRYGVVSDKC